MTEYRHPIAGFFVKREEAQTAYSKLIDRGLLPEQLGIYDKQTAAREPTADANSNATLKNLIVDGAVGAAIGSGLGGVIGAAIGSESCKRTEGQFADMVQDAIMNDQAVLVAQTFNEKDATIAQEVIKESVGHFNTMGTI